MRISFTFIIACICILTASLRANAQSGFELNDRFETSTNYVKIGAGMAQIGNGILTTQEAYLLIGEPQWKDYEFSVDAQVPATEEQVQIWLGFRNVNRDDRYILGLRGGTQNNLYLARLGEMGADDHLALRRLDFPLKKETWYNLKVQVVGNRIRVFLNRNSQPIIDLVDKNGDLAMRGEISLGGSWIVNRFDNLTVRSLERTALANVPTSEYAPGKEDKEALRKQQRAQYTPLRVQFLQGPRTTLSLNGTWLFAPSYEVSDEQKAVLPNESDEHWHTMNVPDFWNPLRIWLHGERYNTASKGVSDNYFEKETARCEAYTFDYRKTGEAWYRHWIELPEEVAGKQIDLAFDAISKVGEVWINGKKAGSHVGMFGPFSVNATGRLKPGKNLIAVNVVRDYVKDIKDANKIVDVAVSVEVTNKMLQDLAHGFYQEDPAGIWQPVSLIITDPLRINDVFIKPNLSGASFEVTVRNNSNSKQTFDIATGIISEDSGEKLYEEKSLGGVTLNAGETRTLQYEINGLSPKPWSPEKPNLYAFSFQLLSGNKQIDKLSITSGFRTFEVKGDSLLLNGTRFWMRGANHTPASLAPNDTALANKFLTLFREGNVNITRSHTAPFTETWMNAADRIGIGVSFEGTWPWLMIESNMPEERLITLWRNEFYDLLKKYRNHVSLLMWTVNNEMKFYDNDPDFERAKVKMKIISDVVRNMREIDPTRPMCFDSNYGRNEKKFGKSFFNTIDDGDIDDKHWYVNWYHGTLFSEFKGEWQRRFKNEKRPLINQEMSTGYPSETGHPTRFYSYVHQTPQALVGKYTYEYANPAYFLKTHAFITKELAEALRRSNEHASGFMHFAGLTWFKNVYLPDKITPHPTYYEMKKALSPVLVSAELWGRHFYAASKLPVRFCIVNDLEDGRPITDAVLRWEIRDTRGTTISSGRETIQSVAHYERLWLDPTIQIPAKLPALRTSAQLYLTLEQNGNRLAENNYELLLIQQQWIDVSKTAGKKIVIFDPSSKIADVLDHLGVKYQKATTLKKSLQAKADLLILAGLDSLTLSNEEIEAIQKKTSGKNRILLLNSGHHLATLFPEMITGIIRLDGEAKGEIINMDIPESAVFNGLDPLDLRYFNNNKRENPLVITQAPKLKRTPGTEGLASYTKVHGYLPGSMNRRKEQMDDIRGFPIIKINNKGSIILSEVLLQKGTTDPIAGKLLANMILDLMR